MAQRLLRPKTRDLRLDALDSLYHPLSTSAATCDGAALVACANGSLLGHHQVAPLTLNTKLQSLESSVARLPEGDAGAQLPPPQPWADAAALRSQSRHVKLHGISNKPATHHGGSLASASQRAHKGKSLLKSLPDNQWKKMNPDQQWKKTSEILGRSPLNHARPSTYAAKNRPRTVLPVERQVKRGPRRSPKGKRNRAITSRARPMTQRLVAMHEASKPVLPQHLIDSLGF